VSFRFLDVDSVQAIHAYLIDTYGGTHGLRDSSLLQSALDRSENRYYFEPDVSAARLAAAVGWGLIKNHAFLDGNKRMGLAAVIAFLHGNGYMLVCSETEVQAMTLRAAASEISEDHWTAWLEQVAQPTS
jgi:death-on-curing protein